MPFKHRGLGFSVNNNGWSIQQPSPPTYAPDVTPVTIAVVRAGYDSSGNVTNSTDNLVLTQRVMKPYPFHASLTPNTIALSDYIYSTDTIVGGVNKSTEISPTPISMWAMDSRSVINGTLSFEIIAFHKDARAGRQVACVIASATDGTLTVFSAPISGTVVSGRNGDQHAIVVYRGSIDTSTLANNSLITLNGKVYPWVGGPASIADSSLSSAKREFSPRYYYKSSSLAASPFYAYVAPSGGSSGGVFSTIAATAKATPFDTVANMFAALNSGAAGTADGVIVQFGSGTFPMAGSGTSRNQKCAAIIFTRDPTVARASCIVQLNASFRPRLLTNLISPLTEGAIHLTDITIQRSGAFTFTGESANQLSVILNDVDFDANSQTSSWLSNAHDYYYGINFTNLSSGGQLNASTTTEHRILRGVTATSPGSVEAWWTVGSSISSPTFVANAGSRTASGCITAFNDFMKLSGTVLGAGSAQDVVGFAVVQNVWEFISATTNPTFKFNADAATGNTTHFVIHHNTLAGFWNNGRDNVFYDEGVTQRFSKLHSRKGNIHVSVNTKGHVFVGTDSGQAAWAFTAPQRIDNWAFLYGVGCQGEFSQFIDANNSGLGTAFAQAYPGLGAKIGTSNSVRQDPLFTNYQGTTSGPTVGTGGGTYTIAANSPAKTMVVIGLLSHDLAGTARNLTNDTAGAYA